MTEKTLTRPAAQNQLPSPDGAPDDAPSPLLAQAAAHARVAREALADCDQNASAEQELVRRHNRSGE